MRRRVRSGALVFILLALVLATCRDGGIGPIRVASVVVVPESDTVAVGLTLQLSATPQDDDGNSLLDRPVAWNSSNRAVATVSESGLVTALAPGSARIEATS